MFEYSLFEQGKNFSLNFYEIMNIVRRFSAYFFVSMQLKFF